MELREGGVGAGVRREVREIQGRLSRAARFFGLAELPRVGRVLPARDVVECALPLVGELSLITGASGSGKSTLVQEIVRLWRVKGLGGVLEVGSLLAGNQFVVDVFGEEEIDVIVGRLARVGLGEASILGRVVETLSVGERYRLELAAAIWQAQRSPQGVLVVCDEFTSALDEVTAWAVSSALVRSVRASGHVAVLVSTWREELEPALRPDRKVHCDFGAWEVNRSV